MAEIKRMVPAFSLMLILY